MSTESKKQTVKEPQEFISNDNLPSLWIDSIVAHQRGDGITLLGFYTQLPTGTVEQTRIMVKNEVLKKFVDTSSKQLSMPLSAKKPLRKQ